MNRIFLGKPFHWLLLIVLVLIGWLTGLYKSHVTMFNWFVIGMTVVTAAVVLIVLRTTRPDEQVTRDPILPDDEAG